MTQPERMSPMLGFLVAGAAAVVTFVLLDLAGLGWISLLGFPILALTALTLRGTIWRGRERPIAFASELTLPRSPDDVMGAMEMAMLGRGFGVDVRDEQRGLLVGSRLGPFGNGGYALRMTVTKSGPSTSSVRIRSVNLEPRAFVDYGANRRLVEEFEKDVWSILADLEESQ
jgi:hypothetical protein